MTEDFTWRGFDEAVECLAHKIVEWAKKFRNIYGVPRGGLVLAVALSYRLDLPVIVERMAVTSDTLVVDDISDSGKTLEPFRDKGCAIATIHLVPTALVKPDFWVRMRTETWVIYPWETSDA